MSQLTDRVERDLREIAAAAQPSPSAWESIMARLDDDAEPDVTHDFAPDPDTSKRPLWFAAAAAALLVVTASVAVLATNDGDDHSISNSDPDGTTNTTVDPPTTVTEVPPTIAPTAPPFLGSWVSTDTDGSSQTMQIVRSAMGDYGIVVHDDAATAACAGAPATITGTGQLETDVRLVIPQAELTCDDGTVPALGPPPQADLANFTLQLNATSGAIIDPFGIEWQRAGSNDEPIASSPVTVPASVPTASSATVPALAPGTSGGMWPQSTIDEVRAAQQLADAGDPAYTWQLDAMLAASGEPWGAEIFARFMHDQLGWEEFAVGSRGYASAPGIYEEIVFIRCASGQTNPLSPLFVDAPADIRQCAPTIDDLTYETVRFTASQPDRRGTSGIWVVDEWEIEQPGDSGSLFGLIYPDYSFRQVEQVAPPSDAEATAFLEAFLQARVNGEGVEQYLLREPEGSPFDDMEVPVLYATTGGAAYVRSEFERVQGPVWPTGWMEYKVRLFAEDGSVVEQYFHVVGNNGELGLIYGYSSNPIPTTENGQSVPVKVTDFGGTVSFTAPPPVNSRGDGSIAIPLTASGDGFVKMAVDPRPDEQGCGNGPALAPTADATALALSIEGDPTVEVIGSGSLPIDFDGLQMDVAFSADAALCYGLWAPDEVPVGTDTTWRMRLYLINYPDEATPPPGTNWQPRVLTIAIVAPEADSESALSEAQPIVESVAFQPGH